MAVTSPKVKLNVETVSGGEDVVEMLVAVDGLIVEEMFVVVDGRGAVEVYVVVDG